jgi:hypothetical protein
MTSLFIGAAEVAPANGKTSDTATIETSALRVRGKILML